MFWPSKTLDMITAIKGLHRTLRTWHMGLNSPSSVLASSPICGSFHDRSSTLYYHRIYITTLVQPSVQHSRIIVRIAFSHQLCFYTCILHIIVAYHYCFNNKCSIMYIRIPKLSLSMFSAFNNPESKPPSLSAHGSANDDCDAVWFFCWKWKTTWSPGFAN